MIANSGLLSQSIINLFNLREGMLSISNLPPSAQGIQETAAGILNDDQTILKALQAQISHFTTMVEPVIDAVIATMQSGTISPHEIKVVEDINLQAKDIRDFVQAKSLALNASKEQLISLKNNLLPIRATLQADINNLSVEIDSANREVESLNQRKYYLIALGPFGLVGLAAIIGLLVTWNNKINDLKSRSSNFEIQITMLNSLINNIDSMMGNFNTAVGLVSNIKNGTDFLSSDITVVIADLKNADGKLALIYMMAASQQVKTLATDAS
jgi:hypothetical protein